MTIPDTLHALVAEVALKHAHELDRTASSLPAREEALETSAGASESLGLGYHLGAAMERIALAAGEGSEGTPRLREAAWLIDRYVTLLEEHPPPPALEPGSVRDTRSESKPEPEAEAAPDEVPVVHELPTIRRELIVTAARAAIYAAAVTVVVLVLTLIAQWL